MTGRQKSDDRVVPEERRKPVRADVRQGKAVTVSKEEEQLGLFGETAANPKAATAARTSSPLGGKRNGVPKSPKGKNHALSPMTMEEIRALILKQWKRKRHIVNRLVHMGVPAPLARVDVNARRRSWWSPSEVRAVCRGLTNEYFERRGLFALHAHWRHDHERIWDIGPKQLALPTG